MTEAFRCPECGYPTTNGQALVDHMHDAHDDESFSLADVVDCESDDSDDDSQISDILI